MTKRKSPLDKTFHRAITTTLGEKSPYELARENGLPHQAIARVLEGTNPELSRAIEIANALGFEIRYEWPHNSRLDMEMRSLAARLAMHEMLLEFRWLAEIPDVWLFAHLFARKLEEVKLLLGPSRTDDPHKTYAELLEETDRHDLPIRTAESRATS